MAVNSETFMNICSKGHDEIVFENHACPMCELTKTDDKEIARLEERIDHLENEVCDLDRDLKIAKGEEV